MFLTALVGCTWGHLNNIVGEDFIGSMATCHTIGLLSLPYTAAEIVTLTFFALPNHDSSQPHAKKFIDHRETLCIMANEVRSDHNARDEIIDSHADEHLEISALEYTLTDEDHRKGQAFYWSARVAIGIRWKHLHTIHRPQRGRWFPCLRPRS